MIYIGVDPGTTGAIAFISTGVSEDRGVEVFDFKSSVCSGLGKLTKYESAHAIVEKVHSMPKQGVATTFKFGTSYGIVQGWLQAFQIPYELVTPGKWWKGVSDSATKGKDKKAMSLDLARRLFPQLAATRLRRKKDHNRAEALLIAEYCRRTHI